jgi:hypothetical protein
MLKVRTAVMNGTFERDHIGLDKSTRCLQQRAGIAPPTLRRSPRPLARLHLSPGDPPKGPSDFDQRPPRIARLQSITDQSDQIGTDCLV